MKQQTNSPQYINKTIEIQTNFIQLLDNNTINPTHYKQLKNDNIHINYYYTNDTNKINKLFKSNIKFPLVNQLTTILNITNEHNIPQLQPTYHSRLHHPKLAQPTSVLLQQHQLNKNTTTQKITLTTKHYFTNTTNSIYHYDNQ